MSHRFVVVSSIVAFVLGSIGGWFGHSAVVRKDYEQAWTGYEKEVKAWQNVDERYRVLEPMCGDFAGEAECGELKTAGEEASKAAETLPLDMTKAKSDFAEETTKVEEATSEIKTEREKFEPAVEKVEKAAEATITDKFPPVLEEAEKKAAEGSEQVSSLTGKVKDEKTVQTLKGAIDELSSACGKWKGKDAPSGQEGVQAYLELKHLIFAFDDAMAKAKESHDQWQAEEDKKLLPSLAGEYSLSSGAGAWGTDLTINADGTFSGSYYNTDAGSKSKECPQCTGGTRYLSDFTGKLSHVKKISDYEYRATIDSIEVEKPVGSKEVQTFGDAKVLVEYTEPSGMTDKDGNPAIGKEITIYLPGMKTSDFPQQCGKTIIPLIDWKGDVISGNVLQKKVLFVTETCRAFSE